MSQIKLTTTVFESRSSCEFIDGGSLACVTQNLQLTSPLQVSENTFYMLIETSGKTLMESFIDSRLSKCSIARGLVPVVLSRSY